MWTKDFYNYDGNMAEILQDCTNWLIQEKPISYTMSILKQEKDSTIHIRFYCEE